MTIGRAFEPAIQSVTGPSSVVTTNKVTLSSNLGVINAYELNQQLSDTNAGKLDDQP